MQNLSVVHLCPAEHREVANSVAFLSGYGPDNLSVPLVKPDGSIWYGCHAWWSQEALEASKVIPEGAPEEAVVALAAVITSVREGGIPYEHWTEVLQENQLSPLVQNDV